MGKKLYVGNLKFSVTSDELKEMFSRFGDITDATVISDRQTGRSKGFGFVEFADDDAAENAIAEMNGQEYAGRNLNVNEARPRQPRPAGGGFGGGGGDRRGGGGGRGGYGGDRRGGGGGGGGYGGGRDRY